MKVQRSLRALAVVAVLSMLPSAGLAASFTMGPSVSFTEGDSPIAVLPDFTLGTGGSYAGGNITFSLDGTDDPGEVLSFIEGEPSISNGVIRVQNGTIFKGNGTTASAIGNIDATLNGQAKDLKVNFSNAFTNGDFSQGATGWSISNARVQLGYATANGTVVTEGATVIGGWPAPVDYLWGPGNQPNAANPGVTRRDRATGVTGTFSSTTSGNLAMTYASGSCPSQGFCVVRGPSVISDSSVYLGLGDAVSFTWQAEAIGDSFDVYGYLLNTANGKAIRLIDETGTIGTNGGGKVTVTLGTTRNTSGYFDNPSQRRTDLVNYQSGTPSVGASSYDDTKFTDGTDITAGNYKFVFVAGSYDDNGLTGLSARFIIDNITVSSSSDSTVTAEDIQALARLLTYSNSNASNSSGTVRNRVISFSSSQSDTGDTATIAVTAVNDAPTIAAISSHSYTDTSAVDTFATVTGTLSATDEEGDPISFGLVGATVSGTTARLEDSLGVLTINTSTGAYTFTPNQGAINALDSDTSKTFTFTASDGSASSTRTWVINITATVDALPGPPVISSVTAADRALVVNFAAPLSAGTSAILNYKYSTDGVTYLALSPESTATSLRITTQSNGVSSLVNRTEYSITLRAVNSTGDSVSSNNVSGTPAEPAASPAPSTATAPAPTPTPTASPTPRPSPRPSVAPRPSPAPQLQPQASPAPSPTSSSAGSGPQAQQTPEQVASQIRVAQQSLSEPATPSTIVEQLLLANPDIGRITEQGLVALNPAQSLVVTNGQPETVQVFPNELLNGYIVEGSDFRLAVSSSGSDGAVIEMDSEGTLLLSRNQVIEVQGRGFAPGTEVVVWLFSEPQRLGEIRANADGNFQGSVPIMESLLVGEHTVQINGVTPSGETRTVSMGVKLIEEAPGSTLGNFGSPLLPIVFAVIISTLGLIVFVVYVRSRKRR